MNDVLPPKIAVSSVPSPGVPQDAAHLVQGVEDHFRLRQEGPGSEKDALDEEPEDKGYTEAGPLRRTAGCEEG